MLNHRVHLALALLVFVAGGAALLSLVPSRSKKPEARRVEPSPDAVLLGRAAPSPLSGADAASLLRARLADAPAEGAPSPMTDSLRHALADQASQRLGLLLKPDYDRLRELLRAWGGSDVVPATDADRDLWLGTASGFADTPLDIDQARIVVRWDNGRLISSRQGRSNSTTLGKGYGRLTDPAKQRLTVVDVLIPAEVRDVRTRKPMRAYLAFAFAWDQTRSVWQPMGCGVIDPSGSDNIAPSMPF